MDHQAMLFIDYGSPSYIIYGLWITKLYYLWIMNHQTILLWIMDHQAILFMDYGSPSYIKFRILSVEFSDHIPIWFSSWL